MNAIDASLLLGHSLEREAKRMRDFAHQPEHYIRIDKGEHVEARYPEALRYRQKEAGWETRLTYTYSVDVLPGGRAIRHLCIQMSTPGEVTQGELNATKDNWAQMLEGIARTFFPVDPDLGFHLRAMAPVPIVDPTSSDRNVHFRTTVAFHFIAEHGHVEVDSLPAPEREYIASEVVEGIAALMRDRPIPQLNGMAELGPMVGDILAGDWKKYVPART